MDINNNFKNDEENIILLADLDDALVVIRERIGMPPIAVYDSKKCVEILMDRYDTAYENALAFFDFSICGAYLGESTSIFIRFAE